jgi:hypothetical protein
MQNAKDTFYLTLQQRLTALNPARTTVVRGLRRAGTLVTENELPTAQIPLDTFRVAWTACTIDRTGALPLITLGCEIRYATDGSHAMTGMDRGRALAQMDAELAAALAQSPQSTPKLDCSQTDAGTAPTPMQTSIFWSAATSADAKATNERLERTVTVDVFAYQEAGEM